MNKNKISLILGIMCMLLTLGTVIQIKTVSGTGTTISTNAKENELRDAVLKAKIPHVVSTRGIGKVYKKDINGLPVQDILTSNVIKNLSQDDVNSIIGNMRDVSSNNKYFEGVKRLTLRR